MRVQLPLILDFISTKKVCAATWSSLFCVLVRLEKRPLALSPSLQIKVI